MRKPHRNPRNIISFGGTGCFATRNMLANFSASYNLNVILSHSLPSNEPTDENDKTEYLILFFLNLHCSLLSHELYPNRTEWIWGKTWLISKLFAENQMNVCVNVKRVVFVCKMRIFSHSQSSLMNLNNNFVCSLCQLGTSKNRSTSRTCNQCFVRRNWLNM